MAPLPKVFDVQVRLSRVVAVLLQCFQQQHADPPGCDVQVKAASQFAKQWGGLRRQMAAVSAAVQLHCVFTAYPLPLRCLSTVVLPLRCLFAASSRPSLDISLPSLDIDISPSLDISPPFSAGRGWFGQARSGGGGGGPPHRPGSAGHRGGAPNRFHISFPLTCLSSPGDS